MESVPVGTNPIALAASRGAIWVVNAGDDTVSRISTSTHAVQQTIDVGHDPRDLVVTGDDLWVTNFADGTVSRINVEDNKLVDTIDVGSGPDAIAAGPAGLWVANSGDNTIQPIDTTNGKPGDLAYVGDGPDGLAVDDTSIWVANGRSGTVTRIDASTGNPMTSPIRVGSGPRGIVRVGEDVWVADELSQSVTRITVASPSHTRSYGVGDGPTDIAVLDGSIWVAEKYSGDLVQIDPSTDKIERIAVRAPVHGVAVADGRLWVTSGAFASTSHRGGTLTIAAAIMPGADDNGIDPARAYDPWTMQAVRVIYDGLLASHYTSADPQVLVPDLATSKPESTDGGKTFIFNLRPGIRYSTGDEVKASDFAWGVKRALVHGSRPGYLAGIVGGQACIEDPASCDVSRGVVADDLAGRVTFHLVAPDPQFLYKLTLLVVPTPPETPLGKITSPIPGTGPYRIASYSRDEETKALTALTLARNQYFQQWSAPAQPDGFVDSIVWVKAARGHKAVQAVQEGRADLAEFIRAEEEDPASIESLFERLNRTAPSRMHSSIAAPGTFFAVLNSSTPPFNQLLARQAFNYAIDRTKAIAVLGLSSQAGPTCQLLPSNMPTYQPYCPYTTGAQDGTYHGPDLARARDLVQASGTHGMKVTVLDVVGDLYSPLEPYYVEVLRKLGYEVTFLQLPNTRANRRLFYNPGSGIQVKSGFFAADFPLPANFYDLVECNALDTFPFAYCNRDLDRRVAAATAMMETEPGKALAMWAEIDRELTDEAPLVPVLNPVDWWITSGRVDNYKNGAQMIGPLLSQLWVR